MDHLLTNTLVHTASDMIIGIDLTGTIIYANPAAQKFYGYQEDDLIGQPFTTLLPKAILSEFDQIKENLLLNEYADPFESQRVTIEKKKVKVSVSYSVIKGEKNKIIGISCIERKITEYRNAASKAQALLETAPDAMVIVNASGQIVLVNAQTEQLFGYKKSELLGQDVEMLLPGQLGQKHIKHREAFFKNPKARPMGTGMELLGQKKSGGQFPIEISLSPFKAEEGTLVSAAIRDITVQKAAEAALRWSQRQLDAFFTQALDGFFFMMLDKPIQWDDTVDKDALIEHVFKQQRITRVNDAMLEQFRTSRENFIGLTPADFFEQGIEEGKKAWKELFTKGRLHIESKNRRFDGTEMWVEGDYICMYDDEGKIAGHFGIQRDITDRILSEKKLSENEKKYRLLADNMLDMVALHAPDGTYQYLSPSVYKILGFKPKELIGQTPYAFFHPEDIERIREGSHTPANAGEEIPNMEYRIQKKDGSYIWFSTNTKPIKDESGEVIMLQTVSRDVTERVGVLQRLEEINAQKNKLFSVIGHDLRSPLSSCIGLLDLIDMEVKDLQHKELDTYLSLLRQSAVNLLDLLDDLLMWVSTQSDEIALKPHMLDLSFEITKVVHHLAEAAKVKNIGIRVSVDKTLRVFADGHMLDTVIRNLVSNSIKFTHKDGLITISARLAENMIIVSVTDNGIGMQEETLQMLFANTRNHTVQGTKGEKGTGLGLQLCKGFVERLGGSIWVESEYGKGSTFSFSVPNSS